ncbi:LuxR family transcriptional regulator [Mesorhizobium sp. ORM8.1]
MSRMERLAIEFGRFLDRTDGVVQPKRLFDLLSDFSSSFDCPWISYGAPEFRNSSSDRVGCDPAIMLNYPHEWQERYFKMGYDQIDPVIKNGRKRASAFRWSEIYNDAGTTEAERRVLDEAAKFGLKSGITIPLHGPNTDFALMSFAQKSHHRIKNITIIYLQFAALHFLERWGKMGNTKNAPGLSPREMECLQWAARGKSSWETGVILNVSLNTVNFHIKNAMRKLDCTNRTVAAIRAIDLGIIEP